MDNLEPRIHDEIKDYKEKFYNFTLRQWIFAILIIIVVVPLYILLSPIIGKDITGWIVIILAVPIGFFGFIPIQGMNAEKIVFYWKRNYINFAKPLLYKTDKELLEEKRTRKRKKHKNTSKPKVSNKEIKRTKKEEKLKQKQIKIERKKERELALAKKKYGNLPGNGTYGLSEEETQVLLKLAKNITGKEKFNEDEENQKE